MHKTPEPDRAVPEPHRSQSLQPTPPAAFPAGIFAGTSGWAYATWKPGFYPEKLPAKRFLEHYATRLNAVEVNYTFRALPTATMLAGWLAATPPNFRFSFKAPQRITHFSRLANCESQVEQFLAALAPVREAGRLGPILFQLPPNFQAAATDRLRDFLAAPVLAGPEAPAVAFEFRHPSWFAEPVYEILREYSAALCVAEGDELATPQVHTSPGIACFRLRRSGGYTSDELAGIARNLHELAAKGREVYAFLRHEDEPTGALNAGDLLRFARECEA